MLSVNIWDDFYCCLIWFSDSSVHRSSQVFPPKILPLIHCTTYIPHLTESPYDTKMFDVIKIMLLIFISIMLWVWYLVYLLIKLGFSSFGVSAKIIYRDTNSNIKAINHKSQYLTASCNLRVAYIWIQILCFLNVHTLAAHQKFRVSEAASCQMIEHWCFENELFSKAGKLTKRVST